MAFLLPLVPIVEDLMVGAAAGMVEHEIERSLIGSKDPSKRSLRVSNEAHARSDPRMHENIPPMRTNDSTVYRTTVKGHPTGNADLHNVGGDIGHKSRFYGELQYDPDSYLHHTPNGSTSTGITQIPNKEKITKYNPVYSLYSNTNLAQVSKFNFKRNIAENQSLA